MKEFNRGEWLTNHAADLAWIGLIGAVALYDIKSPPHQTLSEGFDKYLQHPYGRFAAIGGVILTAAHLLNILPPEADPIHKLAESVRAERVRHE